MLRAFLTLLAVLIVGYVAVVAYLYAIQEHMLYFPTSDLTTSPAQYGMLFETVRLQTEDGELLHGWWVPAEKEERAVLLFFHGNAGNISNRIDSIEIFHRLGLSVLLFDYRGYGHSTGTPSEEGLYRDAEAAWRYLTEVRRVDPSRIVLFGRSLGGGAATWLATQHNTGALIIESTFTSVPDVAAEHYPFLPVRLLARSRFDNLSRIDDVQTALLIVHSPDDEIIPFEHGKRLFEAARQNKTFLQLEGGHNDGIFATGARYVEEMDVFLRRHLGR
ncbi:MAG: alpha/beta hydrolase [Rhodothermales bacterium]